jgi:hypothetical protein
MKVVPAWDKQVLAYLKAHPDKTDKEVALSFSCQGYQIANVRARHGIKKRGSVLARTIEEAVAFDKKNLLDGQNAKTLEDKYDFVLQENGRLKGEMGAVLKLREDPRPVAIKRDFGSGTSEATAVVTASDWHIEEEVRSSEVNGLNEYTLEIAHERTTRFFQNVLRLIRMAQKDVSIKNLVLGLLGDFISGSIHEELLEINQLSPSDAIWEAQNIIIAGIDFLLNNSDLALTIPCKSGNHGRTTKKVRHASEEGNSLEAFMYNNLALHYAKEKRVRFIISNSYHIYLPVYDFTVRFHHGHAINYGGGVGGIYIPVNKAIAQWNKATKAYMDFFGHFHQMRDGGNFVSNGSIIGHNAYAISIKADYEKPRQTLVLIDKKRGKTIVAPVLVDKY